MSIDFFQQTLFLLTTAYFLKFGKTHFFPKMYVYDVNFDDVIHADGSRQNHGICCILTSEGWKFMYHGIYAQAHI